MRRLTPFLLVSLVAASPVAAQTYLGRADLDRRYLEALQSINLGRGMEGLTELQALRAEIQDLKDPEFERASRTLIHTFRQVGATQEAQRILGQLLNRNLPTGGIHHLPTIARTGLEKDAAEMVMLAHAHPGTTSADQHLEDATATLAAVADPSATNLLLRGITHLEKGELAAAKTALLAASKKDPSMVHPYAVLSHLYLVANEHAPDARAAELHLDRAALLYGEAMNRRGQYREDPLGSDLYALQDRLMTTVRRVPRLSPGGEIDVDRTTRLARAVRDEVIRSRTTRENTGLAVSLATGATMWLGGYDWKSNPRSATPASAEERRSAQRLVRLLQTAPGSLAPRERFFSAYVTDGLPEFLAGIDGQRNQPASTFGFLPLVPEEVPASTAEAAAPGGLGSGGSGPGDLAQNPPAGLLATDPLQRARQAILDTGIDEESRFASAMEIASAFSDPIALDLDGSGQAELTPDDDASRGVSFDVAGTGFPQRVQWLDRGHDGWLCEDAGGDGVIRDGHEMFGTAGGFAHGFVKLARRDTNRDGRVSGTELAGLAVWTDGDADGVSGDGELTAVGKLGIESIEFPTYGLTAKFTRNGKTSVCWDVWPHVFIGSPLASR